MRRDWVLIGVVAIAIILAVLGAPSLQWAIPGFLYWP
jgi:hypothetical protein